MQTITNEDGTTTDVFTAEELEAQKQEAIEAYKLENPDKGDELTALQDELEKLKKKDLNFEGLRKQKTDADKKVEDILKGVDEKISTVKKEVMEGVMKDYYNETLKVLADDDEDIKKKIEFHYKRLGDVAATKEEMGSKLRDAYLLATKPTETDAFNTTVLSSGGVGRINIKNQEKKFSPEEKSLGGKFGLSDEDFKKFGGQ
jgi:hypothetical protein